MALLLNANDSVNRSYTITKPSPNHPLDVNGVGVRTKNLLKNDAVSTEFQSVQYTVNADKSVTVYGTASPKISYIILMGDGAPTNNLNAYTTPIFKAGDTLKFSTSTTLKLQARNTDGTFNNNLKGKVTLSKDIGLIYIQVVENTTADETVYPMITLSTETDTTYEPWGYKIPISSGGVTTNIYLGNTQTTRQIKKLVLDGTENWSEGACTVGYRFYIPITRAMQSDTTIGVRSMCTHQILVRTGETYNTLGAYTISAVSDLFMTLNGDTRLASWKSWLAAQYAAGTPVTVYYVLATPETATVNEPLQKIVTYADTLSNATAIPTTEGANNITVDTIVQPSEFTATWTGWHNASVKEWDGQNWT